MKLTIPDFVKKCHRVKCNMPTSCDLTSTHSFVQMSPQFVLISNNRNVYIMCVDCTISNIVHNLFPSTKSSVIN